jgi:hypothetical protein
MAPKISTSPDDIVSIPYWMAFCSIAISVILVELLTDPLQYADIDSYILYLDQLVHFPPKTLYIFEPLSNLYFLGIHWIFGSVETSIVVSHYMLGAIFVTFMGIIYSERHSSWHSIIFIFAIIGPLLAFITLRATPAYFLIAISARHAHTHDRRSLAYFVAAVLFHASALLTAIPLLLLYFHDSLPKLLKIEKPAILIGILLVFGVAVISVPQISSLMNSLFQSIPFLSKFTAYTDQSNVANTVNNFNHYIFFGFAIVLASAFFWLAPVHIAKMHVYIISSLIIYFVLFFLTSPVAAFRQAPFWMMPMIAAFPWRKAGVTEAISPLFALFCAVLFYLQLMQVYT